MTNAAKVTGAAHQPKNAALAMHTTPTSSCGIKPCSETDFGLLLMMGKSLTISQLSKATRPYQNHWLVSRFRVVALLLVQ